jgi:hypothetical protein
MLGYFGRIHADLSALLEGAAEEPAGSTATAPAQAETGAAVQAETEAEEAAEAGHEAAESQEALWAEAVDEHAAVPR